jgi:Leucine-rich repeat (LRR) protein
MNVNNFKSIETLNEKDALKLFFSLDLKDIPTYCKNKSFFNLCKNMNVWTLRWNKEYNDKDILDDTKSIRWNYYYRKCLEPVVDVFNANIKELYNKKIVKLNSKGYTFLPESIVCLKNTEQLSLFDNKLTTLPKTMKNMSLLHTLVLTKNRFEKIPEFLFEMQSLKKIWFDGNPINFFHLEYLLSKYQGWNATEHMLYYTT